MYNPSGAQQTICSQSTRARDKNICLVPKREIAGEIFPHINIYLPRRSVALGLGGEGWRPGKMGFPYFIIDNSAYIAGHKCTHTLYSYHLVSSRTYFSRPDGNASTQLMRTSSSSRVCRTFHVIWSKHIIFEQLCAKAPAFYIAFCRHDVRRYIFAIHQMVFNSTKAFQSYIYIYYILFSSN